MLCHHCSSKYHLLSSCTNAVTHQKINYLSRLEAEIEETEDSDAIEEICLENSWVDVTERESKEDLMTDEAIYDILLQRRDSSRKYEVCSDIQQKMTSPGNGYHGLLSTLELHLPLLD